MSQLEQPKPESGQEESLKKSDGGQEQKGLSASERRVITEALSGQVVSSDPARQMLIQLLQASSRITGGCSLGSLQWVVAGKYSQPAPLDAEGLFERGNITIGEALEATALTAGNRPVDYSDAAAIQAAEVRATGRTNIVPGGVAAAAQSAATRNARATRDEEKTKLSEILAEATSKLPADKPVTRRDAEGVIGAELRNDPNLTTRPGGVAASLAAAARLNQSNQLNNPNNTNKQ